MSKYFSGLKALVCVAAAFVCGGAWAEGTADENGIVPHSWYTFDEHASPAINHGSYTGMTSVDVSSGSFENVSDSDYAWKMEESTIELYAQNNDGNVYPTTYIATINLNGGTYQNAVVWGANGQRFGGPALVVNGDPLSGYTVKFCYHENGSITDKISYTVPASMIDSYHQYAVTIADRANGTCVTSLYVDGILVGSESIGFQTSQNGMIRFGWAGNGYKKVATGLLYSDFRFYQQVLTEAQISKIYAYNARPTKGVMSINICNSPNADGGFVDTTAKGYYTLAGFIPGGAWQNVGDTTNGRGYREGSKSNIAGWSGSQITTINDVAVTWSCNGADMGNLYSSVSANDNPFLKCYYGRKNQTGLGSASFTVSNIPYEAYDVIVYVSASGNNTKVNQAIKINGTLYYGDEDVGQYNTAKGSSSSWGTPTATSSLTYGANVIRCVQQTSETCEIKVESGSAQWGIAAIQIIEVEARKQLTPGETTDPQEEEPTAEELAQYEPVAVNDDAAAAGQAAILKVVKKQLENGNWVITVDLDETKMLVGKKVEDTAVAFASIGLVNIAGSTTAQQISIPATAVTPGAYYSVIYGDSPTALTSEGMRALATSAGVTITVPAMTGKNVQFFRVKASATPN